MAAPMTILALDPGEVVLGYCLGSFTGQQRSIIQSGDLRDVDADKAVRWLDAICCDRWPLVIAVESYVFQGTDRSGNKNAFNISRLVGALQGAALMWSKRANDSITQVILVSKSDANASIGLTGATPKSRVRRAIEALFPGTKFANEHQVDAAAVLMAGRARAGRFR
ncbi:MAG TPA: hypothetical protein VJN18_32280 [Polyangiaceae bacterium]|nr:hypothetical protein [Polyangiaceae bacterium]